MSTDPSPTPPPPPAGGGGALPLQIGKAFIKQYYKTLVNTPAQLNRFYQPDSTVSRGMEPSAPTEPSCVAEVLSAPANGEETSQGERVRKTFFDWAGKGIDEGGEDADDILRIELQGGAIDAQESVGGGILLVVTGHMYLPGKSSEKAYSFVHTFFLNNGAPPGRKKQFYVKNDILRFLEPAVAEEEEVVEEVVEEAVEEPEVAEVAEAPETQAEEPASEVEDVPVEVTETAAVIEPIEYEPAADEEKVEVVEDEVQEPMAELSIEEEPAAEEEKIDVSTSSEESPPSSPSSAEGKKKRSRRRRGGKSRSRSNSPDVEEEKGEEQPKAPSSWANLVASGASKKSESASDSKKGSKSKGSSKPDEKSSAKAAPAKAPPQSQPPTKESATQPQATQNKRTPEATLFIRNIPDPTKEEEIRALFEPHGNATGNKILGITLNTNRGFCFVDFDGQAAVNAIVDEAKSSLVKDPRTGRKDKSSFMAHGRVLDVERKVPGDRKSSGGNAGGGNSGKFNRSSSPKDSGRRYGNRGSRGGGGGGGGGGSRRSPSRGGNR
eukprot:CAMPEP_0113412650 /NCGR_PEP_ID=MMETSP0013_2-20120614/22957_1 /TAXON_ID=2843 ORGANISM="Skeletonema costatum, Strain 1716" /NCGR_SAMPLE_ID=MMETSP0013_2 /ASSEMBLY_ACC=CAM_ASM_000158 /LENGTH=550 /DNA_ID=CAMNT_0000299175 /DNA_START=182 /DNA_END=1834 /DNA_ORIENTATION=+ /assembly_acc=CAM_ASM_000158